MHLKTVLEKMSSQYKLDLDTRPPFDPVTRRPLRRGPRGTAGTRSKPAAPAGSAKCS